MIGSARSSPTCFLQAAHHNDSCVCDQLSLTVRVQCQIKPTVVSLLHSDGRSASERLGNLELCTVTSTEFALGQLRNRSLGLSSADRIMWPSPIICSKSILSPETSISRPIKTLALPSHVPNLRSWFDLIAAPRSPNLGQQLCGMGSPLWNPATRLPC